MIYISSSCIKNASIIKTIEELVKAGFANIELSGGSEYYNCLEQDVLEIQKKYQINLLVHNYFPPPQQHFVLNLASLNDDIFDRSVRHYLNAIELSKKIKADRFSLHAGFFMDISAHEVGKELSLSKKYPKEMAIEKFCYGYNLIKSKAKGLKLYIENNVLSTNNLKLYKKNPFLLTHSTEFFELKNIIDFNLLLDIAHLKVSSNALKIEFEKELDQLAQYSDYFHVSDNDGFADTNSPISENSRLFQFIQKYSTDVITIEIYDDIQTIQNCYRKLTSLQYQK